MKEKKENKKQTTTKEVKGHNKKSDKIKWPSIRWWQHTILQI